MNSYLHNTFLWVAGTFILAVFLTCATILSAIPAIQKSRSMNYWFFVDHMNIEDAVYSECPVLKVDRRIFIDFPGKWRAELLIFEDGIWTTYNPAKIHMPMADSHYYRTTNELRDPLYLSWYLGGDNSAECPWLKPGRYKLTMTWEYDGRFWLPDPLVVEGNYGEPFTVFPEESENE